MGGILWGYKNYFNIEGIDCLSRFCNNTVQNYPRVLSRLVPYI